MSLVNYDSGFFGQLKIGLPQNDDGGIQSLSVPMFYIGTKSPGN
jgi:hypothetical protein